MHEMLQQAVSNAAAMGPAILLQGMQIERPIDVVKATALTAHDKRTILAAWASDFYAVDSKPLFRHIPGTSEPFPSMSFRVPFENLIGVMASDHSDLRQPVSSTSPIA
ncbi:hypothetical protein [Agrobacterium sp. P15N1-A]|uniref:hypothetical protein n=1 Tax=Agrobacterium sp. P15N1-A TaxID=3342820 RepID=UPI0037CEC16A